MDADQLTTALIAQLAESARARELAAAAFDWALAQPITDIIDPELVAKHVIAALSGPAPTALLQTHFARAVAAEQARVADSKEHLEANVPKPVVTEFSQRMTRPARLPRGWAADIVDPAFVQTILANALADVLEDFLKTLPIPRGAGNLLGSLTRRAGKLNVKAVPFSGQASDFAQKGAERMRKSVLVQLRAPKNKPQVDAALARGADAVLGLPTDQVLALLDDPGPETVSGWISATLAHNLARPEITQTVTAQIQAAIAAEGDGEQTIGAFLQRMGDLDTLRADLEPLAAAHFSDFAATDAFAQWLRGVVDGALET